MNASINVIMRLLRLLTISYGKKCCINRLDKVYFLKKESQNHN